MLSGLTTKDGRPIYTLGHIEKLRAAEEEKRKKKISSRTFISQEGAQEHVQYSTADCDGTGGNRGGGKANPVTTPVLTPSGWRKIGELQIGDEICTPYEGIQKVNGIFDQPGKNRVYCIHFDDGTTVTVMDNHRFHARLMPDEPFRTIEAKEIFKRYNFNQNIPFALRERTNGHCVEIPLCGEVYIQDAGLLDLPIHPFLLGYALHTGIVRLEMGAIPLPDFWMARVVNMLGYSVWRDRESETRRYLVKGIDYDRRRAAGLQDGFAAKIPDIYMYAKPECRYDFIHGLFYGKNAKSRRKHPYIDFPHKPFAEQVAEMIRSIGAWVKVVEVNDAPEHAGWWRLLIKHPNEKLLWPKDPYRKIATHWYDVPKEKPEFPSSPASKTFAKGVGAWTFDSYFTKKIVKITQSDKTKCRCITVTGNDHLYLTKGYVINHNTAMLLTKPLPDINNRYFNGIIFRKNKGDFENIIGETRKWYEPLGKYNKSADDMTWNFHSGSHLSLSYFDMPYQSFDDKYRGQQFAYIGIDEVTQMSFKMFKFLTTCSRNTNNIKSRMLFTCNPDPLSWLRKFLDWYIGKTDTIYADGKQHPERKGFIIPERSGKIRYFYSPDDNVDNIVWGSTPYEVYRQIKDIADEGWNESLTQYGHTRETYLVKSFRFTKADLLDNKALMALDEDYIKNLYQQPPEVRARELEGNWDIIRTGNDLIQPFHIDRIIHNAAIMGDRVRRASCDVAGSGGDNCVTWFKIGNHIQDVFVCQRDPYSTIPLIKAKLNEWGVAENNFTYDLQGMGQVFTGAFPNAIPFNNQEAPRGDDRKLYDCQKSQCAYLFAQHTQQAEWSIEPTLLDREFTVGGVTMRLYNILQSERKAIRQDMSKQDRGWCLIHKEQMKHKSLVGHSPDFIEALIMFEIFNVKTTETEIPSFLNGHIRSIRTFSL